MFSSIGDLTNHFIISKDYLNLFLAFVRKMQIHHYLYNFINSWKEILQPLISITTWKLVSHSILFNTQSEKTKYQFEMSVNQKNKTKTHWKIFLVRTETIKLFEWSEFESILDNWPSPFYQFSDKPKLCKSVHVLQPTWRSMIG